ncbi:cytochrome P450 [Trametes cingulata]|nr:cytochrome P450 [Trametes cingulata]
MSALIHLAALLLQALQHIYHKSAYNYVKRRSQNIASYMIVGAGIVYVQAAFDHNFNAFEDANQSTLSKAKDTEYRLPKATTLFRASWDYIPIPVLKLFQYIPVQPVARMYNLKTLFTAYGTEILREKGPQVDTEKQAHSKDVMSILIKANSSSDVKTRLNDDEIMAQMSTLTLAGHETTSNTARGDTEFRMEDLDSMTTCLNAIKETLRVHPIATGLHRVAAKDDVLPLAYPITTTTGETITEIPLRKGQVILISFATYNRFLKVEAGKQTNVGVFANLVIEMQALLAELVEAFQFSPPVGSSGERPELQRAPSGLVMIPLIRGKEELGPAMPLRVSLAQ